MNWLEKRLNVPIEVTAHQSIKSCIAPNGKMCIFCQYYTRNVNCQTCLDCLETENLDNFKLERLVATDPKKKYHPFLSANNML